MLFAVKTAGTNHAYLIIVVGGAKEDRTPDLFAASEALSQLSYSPEQQAVYDTGMNSICLEKFL